MKTLLIYNGAKNIKYQNSKYQNIDYYYSTGIGKISNNIESINCAKRLNEIALSQRDKYSKYIYSLNKYFLKYNLIFEKKLSLYFIADLSGKRTERFSTYVDICHILLLKEKIKEKKIKKIIFNDCSKRFIIAFNSLSSLDYEIESLSGYKAISLIYQILKHIQFYISTFIKLFILKFFKFKNKEKKNIKNLFLSRYPLHINENFEDEKYSKLKLENDYFLISVITDGMHQNLKIKKFIKTASELAIFKKDKKFILLDAFLTYKDIVKSFFMGLFFIYKSQNLIEKNYNFNKINISDYIKEEQQISFLRIPRLLMYERPVKKILHVNSITNFYYYLHEYSYGRFFSYILNQYFPHINKIGFQHGPASMRKILYFLSDKEPGYNKKNYLAHLPMPDKILAEDKISKKVYEAAGYKNIVIMDEIYRLEYLKNIYRKNIIKNTILIACGLHDGEFIFDYLKDEMSQNTDKKYYYKLHPKIQKDIIHNKILKANLRNVIIAQEHISNYLSFVEEVISTYSSVGYEAYLLGIRVRTILLPNKINESPLMDIGHSFNQSFIM